MTFFLMIASGFIMLLAGFGLLAGSEVSVAICMIAGLLFAISALAVGRQNADNRARRIAEDTQAQVAQAVAEALRKRDSQ